MQLQEFLSGCHGNKVLDLTWLMVVTDIATLLCGQDLSLHKMIIRSLVVGGEVGRNMKVLWHPPSEVVGRWRSTVSFLRQSQKPAKASTNQNAFPKWKPTN